MVAYAGLNFILGISCIVASEATARTPSSCPENKTGELGDQVSLLQIQSETAVKRAAGSVDKYTPPPQNCNPCGRCTLERRRIGWHGADTVAAWQQKCEDRVGCQWTPQGKAAGRCTESEGYESKALIFDFDQTLSMTHMYSLLTRDAAYYAARHSGAVHPYVNSDGRYEVFDVTDEYMEAQREINAEIARHAQDAREHEKELIAARNQLTQEGKVHPDDMLEHQREHGYLPNHIVIDEIWGGEKRIKDLGQVFTEARQKGWQLWILSFGVEVEINTALKIAGLDMFFPPERVVGRKMTRNRPRQWPGEGRKCDYIHERIRSDFPLLMDDDNANVRQCHETGFCRAVHTPEGIEAATLSFYVNLDVDSPEFNLLLRP